MRKHPSGVLFVGNISWQVDISFTSHFVLRINGKLMIFFTTFQEPLTSWSWINFLTCIQLKSYIRYIWTWYEILGILYTAILSPYHFLKIQRLISKEMALFSWNDSIQKMSKQMKTNWITRFWLVVNVYRKAVTSVVILIMQQLRNTNNH